MNLRNKRRKSVSPQAETTRTRRKKEFYTCYKCNEKFVELQVYEWHKSKHQARKYQKKPKISEEDIESSVIIPKEMMETNDPNPHHMDDSSEHNLRDICSENTSSRSQSTCSDASEEERQSTEEMSKEIRQILYQQEINNNSDTYKPIEIDLEPSEVTSVEETNFFLTEGTSTNNEVDISSPDMSSEEKPEECVVKYPINITHIDSEEAVPDKITSNPSMLIPEAPLLLNGLKKISQIYPGESPEESGDENNKKLTSDIEATCELATNSKSQSRENPEKLGPAQQKITPEMYGTGTHRLARMLHHSISSISRPMIRTPAARKAPNYSYFGQFFNS